MSDRVRGQERIRVHRDFAAREGLGSGDGGRESERFGNGGGVAVGLRGQPERVDRVDPRRFSAVVIGNSHEGGAGSA
eukprot:11184545-Lingulodinium_polyedra.AAC.1